MSTNEVAIIPGQAGQVAAALRDSASAFSDGAAGALATLSNGDAGRPYGSDPRNVVAGQVSQYHDTAISGMRAFAETFGQRIEDLARATTTAEDRLTGQDDDAGQDIARNTQ